MTTRYRRCMRPKPYLAARSTANGRPRLERGGPGWTRRPTGRAGLDPLRMATRRSDTRVIVLATLGILVFGLIDRGDHPRSSPAGPRPPTIKGSIPFGVARSLKEKVKDGGPVRLRRATPATTGSGSRSSTASSSRSRSRSRAPRTATCVWRGSMNTFVDCNDEPIRIDQLARYPTEDPDARASSKGVLLVEPRAAPSRHRA